MSTFGLFEVGKTGLLAARRSMDVTGHNIANASTPGYSRQETYLEPVIQRQANVSGAGVRVSHIARIRDAFIDAVLRNETGKQQWYRVQRDCLEHLQMVVAEPSENSIRQGIDLFWSAWQDLASDPTSEGARAQVMEQGRSLAGMFRHMGSQIDSLAKDIENDVVASVNRVNEIAAQVADLNLEIGRAIARKEPTSELLDRRDLLIDELSELTGASVTRSEQGASVKVRVGGFPIVDGNIAYKMKVTFSNDTTEYAWIGPDGQTTIMDDVGGKLGGLKVSRDQQILVFRQELEALLVDLVDNVNAVHSQGFPISGTAGDFFTAQPGDYLNSVAVSQSIVDDTDTICASGTSGDSLDGSNALAIARRLDGSDGFLTSSFIDTWTGMVGRLGTMGQRAENGLVIQNALVRELTNRKDSVSGVSIDEEVATLVRQQHSFAAASRVISVADEVIDTIINRMGAGRG